MALKSDDFDLHKVWMETFQGGNGDYYIRLIKEDEGIKNSICTRVSMSGGYAPHEVKMAAFKLFQALEKYGLN